MLLPILSQVRLILYSLLAGMITGIMFDVYRIIRGNENIPRFVLIIEDVLFWIFTGVVVFIFLLITNHANLTTYAYPCIAIGIFLYIKILSNLFLSMCFKLVTALSRAIRIFIKRILYPFRLIFHSTKIKK